MLARLAAIGVVLLGLIWSISAFLFIVYLIAIPIRLFILHQEVCDLIWPLIFFRLLCIAVTFVTKRILDAEGLR